jgi:hypothetical protein
MSHPAALAAAALKRIFQDLGKLTEAELTELAEGTVRVQLTRHTTVSRSTTSSRQTAIDVTEIVQTIRGFQAKDEVAAYLDENDKPFTVAVLKQIAQALGPTVSKAGNRKADIKQNIVQGTVGFLHDSAIVGGGAYLK